MKYSIIFAILITFNTTIGTVFAETGTKNYKIDQHQYIEKLNKIDFLPSLLPVIIENSDVIELTNEQLQALLEWRTKNREKLIATMNKVARKRIEIKEAALSPDVSSARLIQMQNDVFRLQREVLNYKLSCRDLVKNTFNRDNWEDFFLVLAEEEMGVVLPELYISKR